MPAAGQIHVDCSVEDCLRPAAKGGLCHGHYKRKQRGKAVSGPIAERGGTEWERLMRAFEGFADAADRVGEKDSAAAWRRAEWRLEYAIQGYRRRAFERRNRREGRGRLQAAVIRIGRASRARAALARAG
jgi:hypothetical protein